MFKVLLALLIVSVIINMIFELRIIFTRSKDGTLYVSRDDVDGGVYFSLEIKESPDQVSKKHTVTFEVKNLK